MRVLIAGGGTGGHLFPGIALAEEIVTRDPKHNDVLFVGTAKGLEAKVVPQNNFKLELIEVSGLKRVGLASFFKGLLAIPRALLQSLAILRRYRPEVVVGVGGYASGPVVLAAWLTGIPTAVQEQNAYPGFTNRVLSKFAKAVFTAFPGAERHFPKRKVQMLGNPIRRQLLDNYLKNSVPHEKFNLLVFGGSQGSHVVNQRMLEAVPFLDSVRDKLVIQHQTGEKEVDKVREGYAQQSANAEVLDFIRDMSGAYARADAIVCRAGATTLAEITVAKKAAILIPFAAAADNHQELNARSLVEAGAAVMILEKDLTGERLAKEVFALMNPGRRKQMEKAAGGLGHPEAAKEIADVLVEMSRGKWGPEGRKA
ncbi:MAG TPA: undecaprenyldiphospho-muramoylpentapeptide beta-N-acetylglucosaminyltransferase [Myxococcales bacterium]|jgi:UDP-N-acetylglucosamine--N-acetylmuramyl-(pentapeptide) pyrophosphoryl-undecaprenol N-acetylglucosamine transferase